MMDLRFVSLSFQAVMMLRGLRMIGHNMTSRELTAMCLA